MEGDTNQPAIAASVQLLNLPDSTQSTGMVCSPDGYYRLQAKPGIRLFCEVTCKGTSWVMYPK